MQTDYTPKPVPKSGMGGEGGWQNWMLWNPQLIYRRKETLFTAYANRLNPRTCSKNRHGGQKSSLIAELNVLKCSAYISGKGIATGALKHFLAISCLDYFPSAVFFPRQFIKSLECLRTENFFSKSNSIKSKSDCIDHFSINLEQNGRPFNFKLIGAWWIQSDFGLIWYKIPRKFLCV